MDSRRFDSLARTVAGQSSRRRLLGAVVALAVGAVGRVGSDAREACPPGQTANRRGDCGCPAGTDPCTDGCFDLKRDQYNCGACGNFCIGGTCRKGECSCQSGTVLCGGACRDVNGTDLANCGGCGVACPASTDPCLAAVCENGVCGFVPANEGGACDDGNACTQTDTCRDGVCVGSDPVSCTAQDECHLPGECDPLAGACSNPTVEDGTPCNDNNACTSGDSCLAGVCTGGTEVVCTTDNPCLTATCDPVHGCVTNPKPLGTPCADSDRCDGDEACDGAGVCVPGIPVTCSWPGPCQEEGMCDPVTGICTYANKADGTSCDTGNRCTQDTCQAGICVQGPDVVTPTCTGSGPCQRDGACDPATGACAGINVADGAGCDDGDPCTFDDRCTSGVCAGTPRANCIPCETLADCPGPDPDNFCDVPVCEEGVCERRFLPVRTACPYHQDRCVAEARCERLIGPATICRPFAYSDAAACVFPCDIDADCANQAGPCERMACVYDAYIGRGGCVVVADHSQDGAACTVDDIFGADGGGPFSERLCIPDGTCQGGVCTEGPRTYTCPPVPTVQCCFGQRDGCGRPNGSSCTAHGQCCSDSCEGNLCAA